MLGFGAEKPSVHELHQASIVVFDDKLYFVHVGTAMDSGDS